MAETTLTAAPEGEKVAPTPDTPTPTPEQVIIDKTPAPDDWRSSLPDDLKADPFLGRYKSQEEALRGVAAAQKTISAGIVKRPAPDAKPEAVAAYREAIGAPKDAAGYGLKGEELGLSQDALDRFAPVLLKYHVPSDAARELAGEFSKFQQAETERLKASWKEQSLALKNEWGTEKFNRRFTASRRFTEDLAQEEGLDMNEVSQFFWDSGLGNHPLLFRLFSAAAEKTMEDPIIHGEDPTNAPDIVAARIKAIRDDPNHPFNQEGHPQHRKAVDEVLALTQQMLGKEGKRVVSVI